MAVVIETKEHDDYTDAAPAEGTLWIDAGTNIVYILVRTFEDDFVAVSPQHCWAPCKLAWDAVEGLDPFYGTLTITNTRN